MDNAQKPKLSIEQFTLTAIKRLRGGQQADTVDLKGRSVKGKNFKGIHTVFSGFNAAFRQYFGGEADPIKAIDTLVEQKKIDKLRTRKGSLIYLHGEAPQAGTSSPEGALEKMGL